MSILAVTLTVATWIHVPGGAWQATGELHELQTRLKPFVEQVAAEQRLKLQTWSSYTFQYQGQTENKRRFVFVNAFCSPPGPDVKTQFVLVDDGGACFFRVKYDPERKGFFALEFNGEA